MKKNLSSEGDVNLSGKRTTWQERNLGAAARALLAEDARYFLHQSLSTPCLTGLKSAYTVIRGSGGVTVMAPARRAVLVLLPLGEGADLLGGPREIRGIAGEFPFIHEVHRNGLAEHQHKKGLPQLPIALGSHPPGAERIARFREAAGAR